MSRFESPNINIPKRECQFTRSSSASVFRNIRGLLHSNHDVVDVDTYEQRASQIGHADPFPILSSGNVTQSFWPAPFRLFRHYDPSISDDMVTVSSW